MSVQLRVEGGRALVDGRAPAALPPELDDALAEWARVAVDVVEGGRVEPGALGVSRRGRQLAARLSVVLDVGVDYLDPVTGHRVLLRGVDGPAADGARPGPERGEPTPWATGLAIALVVGTLVLVANLGLALPLVGGLGLLGVVVDVAVVAGLTPALWLNRRAPVWRWAVLGTFAGLGVAVPVLLVSALIA